MTGFADPHEEQPRLPAHAKRDADERFLAALNDRLAGAELVDAGERELAALPILFIVGPPRSGTTLLSQLVAKYLEVGYINNLIARFWSNPAVGIRLSQICLGPGAHRSIALRSTHGVTPDIAGPHEFGYFWRSWLRLDAATTHHLSERELAEVDATGLRRVLERDILASFGAPVAFKNVIAGFHARFLTRVHPQSLFVYLTRDPIITACSILQARKARYGTYDAWWSLKPAAFHDISRAASPAQQVALQVHHCRREFEEELSDRSVQMLTISYESLCRAPDAELRHIRDAIAALGSEIPPPSAQVEPLAYSNDSTLGGPLREEIEEFFASHRQSL